MGFRFRKSCKFGPFRVTFSKSGVSTSFGVKGARITRTAKGKIRTTASIPGTGISYVKEASVPKPDSSKGKTRPIIAAAIVIGVLLLGLLSVAGKQPAKDEKEEAAQEEIKNQIAAVSGQKGLYFPQLTDEQKQEFLDVAHTLIDDGVAVVSAERSRGNIGVFLRSDSLDKEIQNAGETAPADWETLKSKAADISEQLLQNGKEIGYKNAYFQVSSNGGHEVYMTCIHGNVIFDKYEEKSSQSQNTESSKIVWISKSGSRYHYDPNCGGHQYTQATKSSAIAKGLTACQKCAKGG